MQIWEGIVLGVVQGITEFLPVSSSGHLIVVRRFFGFAAEQGLAFDAILHFATALAVVVYFRKDIISLVQTAWRWARGRGVEWEERALLIALGIATIPAVLLGILLEDSMETAFRDPVFVIGTLVFGSIVMFAAEQWGKVRQDGWALTPSRALTVGMFQTLALMPGMSRSGMAMSGAMFIGLSRERAARFAFLLAVPLLLGAGAKKMLDLAIAGGADAFTGALIAGAIAAFITGGIVVHFLLRFLRTHTLHIFILYRVLLAGVLAVYFL